MGITSGQDRLVHECNYSTDRYHHLRLQNQSSFSKLINQRSGVHVLDSITMKHIEMRGYYKM